MKAVICTKYGAPADVLKKPRPNDNEVLIKNYATTVTVADCRIRGFIVPASFWLPAKFALGFTRPKRSILGSELSGIIEAVGKNGKKFKAGDEVVAFTDHRLGAYAEYRRLNEKDTIALKPKKMSFEQAATLPFGGLTALHFLKKSNLQEGDSILIYGASGSVGTYAVQISKYFGATVTAVCSTGNVELVKSLGADTVIDYTQTDLSEINKKFDVFFDTVGKAAISKSINLINSVGRYIHAVATPATEIKIRLKLLNTKIKFIGGTYTSTCEDLNFIGKLADESLITPAIDKEFDLNEIASAHEYVDKGHKKGNVVIRIVDNEKR
jgi:NADPH:quinone reductase-like Zn-dependent oxidoreductase